MQKLKFFELFSISMLLLFLKHSSAFDPLRTKDKVWTHFDFAISLAPRGRECYHQYVEEGMVFSISYKVISGGDHEGSFAFVVTHSNGQMIKENYESNHDNMQVNVKESGVYNICLGNQASRFYTKKVHIYIDLFDRARFEKVVKEETEYGDSLGNITKTIKVLNEGIRDMRMEQMRARQNAIHDWYILNANLAYVNRWSSIQCIVIIVSGVVQVFTLRTFFNVPTNVRKPRC